MSRVWLILRETWRLIRRNKVYFLIPIFIALGIIAFLVYTVGPATVIAFMYAGI